MPKDDLFSLTIQVGDKILPEYTQGDETFVGWDVNSRATIIETLTDSDGVPQDYPLTPYSINLETLDKHLSLWFTLYIDGQRVWSRPINGAVKMKINGMHENGFIREFHFTLPKITENKLERLPEKTQTHIGKIEMTCHRCVVIPGVHIPPPVPAFCAQSRYQSATKNDKHGGVCTALGEGFGQQAPRPPSRYPKPRMKREVLLSTQTLYYRPVDELKVLTAPAIPQDAEVKDEKEETDSENMETDDNNQTSADPDSITNGLNDAQNHVINGHPQLIHPKNIKSRFSMAKPDISTITSNTTNTQPDVFDQDFIPLESTTDDETQNTTQESTENTLSFDLTNIKTRRSMLKPDITALPNFVVSNNIPEGVETGRIMPNVATSSPFKIIKTRRSMAKPDIKSLKILLGNDKREISIDESRNTRFKTLVPNLENINPLTVVSPRKPCVKNMKDENGVFDVIVVDDDDDDDVIWTGDGWDDDVIWNGDDSCFFVDVEPDEVPMIDLLDESVD